jgi:hypothetical protein
MGLFTLGNTFSCMHALMVIWMLERYAGAVAPKKEQINIRILDHFFDYMHACAVSMEKFFGLYELVLSAPFIMVSTFHVTNATFSP